MIKLEVADYCQEMGCEAFEPRVDMTYAVDGKAKYILVTCEKDRICRALYKHLKRVVEKEHDCGGQ